LAKLEPKSIGAPRCLPIESAARSVTGDLPMPPSIRARKEARNVSGSDHRAVFCFPMWDELDVRAILIAGLIAIGNPGNGNR